MVADTDANGVCIYSIVPDEIKVFGDFMSQCMTRVFFFRLFCNIAMHLFDLAIHCAAFCYPG